MERFVDRLREALKGPLPGRGAQEIMAPAWRRASLDYDADFRKAAVLILLYPEYDTIRFPLIVRSAGPGPHGGQIALPGGAVETGETVGAAALREAEEELGIDSSVAEILGTLTPFGIAVSRFRVEPVIAFTSRLPAFRPSPAEVADWFPVSAETLVDGSAKETAMFAHAGAERRAPCYRLSGRLVWGATAIVLSEFEALLKLARE